MSDGDTPAVAGSLLGALLLAGLLAYLASLFTPLPTSPAAFVLWCAVPLAWGRVDRVTRRFAAGLVAAGLVALLIAVRGGAAADLSRLATINLPIVALFLAVAFLGLVGPAAEVATGVVASGTAASGADAPAVDGPVAEQKGLWTTLASIHLIGAVINLAMAAIAGDRMARGGRLAVPEATALARSYCAAAFWSPFFVAAAVAHTYAPGADSRVTLPLGVVAALIALALTARELRRASGGGALPGFAPDRSALVLTGSLLGAVLLVKFLLPALSMVVIVAAVTPPLALALLPARARRGSLQRLLRSTLPATSSQVVLFLSAGVFAQGVATLIGLRAPVSGLETGAGGLWIYPLVTAGIIGVGYLGLHPVISIAAWSSVLLPAGADPSLLAFAFLSGWAVGTAVTPLSGMNLFLVGRYGLAPQALVRSGVPYVLRMLLVVSALVLAGRSLQQLLA
ncbi:MAG: hypothetical protein V2I63_03920 [Pseudomonadales bacterium]|nr:hypothetical protein [Pseudomonadales bacterium]